MSVRLTLIPIMEGRAFFKGHPTIYPTERILFSDVSNDRAFREAIAAIGPKPLPPKKRIILSERSQEPRRVDLYGDTITYVYPVAFSRFKLSKNAHQWDRAILAFIAAMPADTPIILFWS